MAFRVWLSLDIRIASRLEQSTWPRSRSTNQASAGGVRAVGGEAEGVAADSPATRSWSSGCGRTSTRWATSTSGRASSRSKGEEGIHDAARQPGRSHCRVRRGASQDAGRGKLAAGVPANEILAECNRGMIELGNRFNREECFLPDLMFGGMIMKGVMAELAPASRPGDEDRGPGQGGHGHGAVRRPRHRQGHRGDDAPRGRVST